MKLFQPKDAPAPVKTASSAPKYPGVSEAMDGSAAIVEMETAASEAAGAYPITPSTQMGEGWAAAVAAGKPNVNGRPLLFFEPEGEHAAAAVTTGMSMTGLRATNFSSGQGIAYMHESLYPAVGKRLTYVLNMACRAMTKHSLNVHCGHDDYHAVDDTGFFQLFAKDVQESADFNLICHRIAELSLNPGICAQDGFLTSHVIESMRLPERDLIREYLGDPSDTIESPTPAQRMVFGEQRRRIPEMFDLDYPAMLGTVQNQESYAQGVAAQRPFYFDHISALADRAFEEYAQLTGRRHARAMGYRIEDADWVLVGQGSFCPNAEAVCDHLRETRGLKVGVLDIAMFRPFPADLVSRMLRGKKGVAVLERTDQPLAADLPLLREIRAAMSQAVENGRGKGEVPHPGLTPVAPSEMPEFYSGCYGLGSRDFQPGDLIAVVENMVPGGLGRRHFYVGIDFVRKGTRLPKLQIWQEQILDGYPKIAELALESAGEVNLLPKGSVAVRIHSVGGWGAITMGKNLTLTVFELLGLHVKANPKYGSEKKGQPTTFYATFAKEPIRLNCELRHVNVVLSPDPNVFRHTDPILGLARGGALVIQSTQTPQEFWDALPARARRAIRDRGIRIFLIDAFKIAREESSGVDLQFRMQGAAFMGAFFRASPVAREAGLEDEALLAGIRTQLEKKFGKLGQRVVEDNVRVVRRGFDEVKEIAISRLTEGEAKTEAAPSVPVSIGQVVNAGQVLINSIPLSSERVTVHPRRNGAVQLKGTEYRGSLLFEADAQGRLTASNQVDLEEYVNGVLLSEMPLRFGREALRAQAVIARSFALFQLQNGKLLRDDQGSQVYTGLRNVTETVRRLVRSTVGEVLTYEGSLLEAYFHSTCGGVTSSARGVFNIPEQRPLQGGVVCRDCRTSPHYRWTREIPSRRLSELYAGAFGDGLGFEVAERLPSGRAKTIAILDRTGAHKDRLTADRFRNNFNSGQPLRQQLPSMLIQSIERQGGSWRVQGNGFGHGVGLCQYGAGGMAGRGAGYREILERYYPEVTVRRLYE